MSKNSSSYAIAQRYTTALFELAEESKKLKPLAEELAALKVLLTNSDDFSRLCNDPTIAMDEQSTALAAIGKKVKLSPLLTNFLQTLATNGRLSVLPAIITAFENRIYEMNDELVAEVQTAVKMKKTQETQLAKMLKEHFGKKVSLDIHVNENLLGGLRVRIAGQLIDASIAGRLQRIESHLNAGIQQIV